jgi:flagellar biosynthesis protein FlhA
MIGERISALSAAQGPNAAPLALVVQPRARRVLAALLRLRAPSVLVLSISELPQTQPIEVVDVVGAQPAQNALPEPQISQTMDMAA